MIRKKRTMIKELFLFCVLIAIVIAPGALLDFNHTQLVDVLNIVELPAEELDSDSATAQNYNVFQRIRATKTALTEKADTLVNFKDQSLPTELKNQLVHTVETQLLTLQNLNALPVLSFPDEYSINVEKRSYIDMKDPHNPINIWNVQISYPQLFVNVCLDIDTSMLYNVTIVSQTNHLIYNPEDMSQNGFLEYLKMGSKSSEYDGERFETTGNYTNDAIQLFVQSYNHITHTITEYFFEKLHGYTIIANPEYNE